MALSQAFKDRAVELPQASVCHRSAGRLRIRIASRRGDADYFAKVVKDLSGLRQVTHLAANPLTGSVLLLGELLDAGEVDAHARARGLFHLLDPAEAPGVPLMHSLVQPVAGVDRSLRAVSGGKVDLRSAIFLALLGTGIYELVRGRFSAPPWYTAFWYAFGLVSMYVIEKAAQGDPARTAD
jgi:hypothetical protein